MNAPEIDNSSLAGLVTDAIESALAMATVQEGYAKKAGELGLQIIHKANAKAQRQIASTIRALQTERDAAETALAAMTEREGVLRSACAPFKDMAGEMFARNWNRDQVAIALDNPGDLHRLTFGDFIDLHAALQHKDANNG